MNDLKQGQRVYFKVADLSGTGKVVGKALTDQPLIGGTYIIEPDETIYSETYPFSHFIVPQVFLAEIPKQKSIIQLSDLEIQEKNTRVYWAEGLILQLPISHNGRNSWLLNYGIGAEAFQARLKKGLMFDEVTERCETTK